jgi:hypothetical protein
MSPNVITTPPRGMRLLGSFRLCQEHNWKEERALGTKVAMHSSGDSEQPQSVEASSSALAAHSTPAERLALTMRA